MAALCLAPSLLRSLSRSSRLIKLRYQLETLDVIDRFLSVRSWPGPLTVGRHHNASAVAVHSTY